MKCYGQYASEAEADEHANDVVDGKCPKCGCNTIEGVAEDSCGYSPLVCEECDSRPCNGSC